MIIEKKVNFFAFQNIINSIGLTENKAGMKEEYLKVQTVYREAVHYVESILENLHMDIQGKTQKSLIHHIESRIKTLDSIQNKLARKGLEQNLLNACEWLSDIAGIRVICHYIDDIYDIAEVLCGLAGVELIDVRDYIKNPKYNGYRSLHIIITVPVLVQKQTVQIPVEIQIRTIAMDFWASLEHQIRYKNLGNTSESLLTRLKLCSDRIAQLDVEMQSINKELQEMT